MAHPYSTYLLQQSSLQVKGDLFLEADPAAQLALPQLGEQLRRQRVVIGGAPEAVPVVAHRSLLSRRLPLPPWRGFVYQVATCYRKATKEANVQGDPIWSRNVIC